MSPRRGTRERRFTARASQAAAQPTSTQRSVARTMLAMRGGRGSRQARSRSPSKQPTPHRRRGSTETASESGEGGGGAEEEEDESSSDLNMHKSQQESNSRYRRQRNLPPFGSPESNVPDSQPPSAQPALDPDPDFEPTLDDLKHFNFQTVLTVKKQTAGGDTVNTKDWSYQTYVGVQTVKLQAIVAHQPGHSIVPPKFASELKIRAKGLTPPMTVAMRNDNDLENALRVWYKVKYQLKKQDVWAQLTIPFEQVVVIESTAPQGTPNASHPRRRTATSNQRTEAEINQSIAEAIGDHKRDITRLHACPDAMCKNHPKPCIITSQYGHLRVGTRFVRDWCAEIADKKATAEKVPRHLMMRMLKEAGRRQPGKARLKPESLMNNSPGVNLYFGGGAVPGSVPGGGYLSAPLQSSPPGSVAGDDDKNTVLYLDWLIKEIPNKKRVLEMAKSALDDEGWGYSDLKTISDAQWKEMGVPDGIVSKIRKHWKAWGKLLKVTADSQATSGSDNPFGDDEVDLYG
jgi:hypothetical protein